MTEEYTGPTAQQAEQRASAMALLPERDRNVLIALGVLQRNVIDARSRFDRDFLPINLSGFGASCLLAPVVEMPVVTTVFEGTFYPGDCA